MFVFTEALEGCSSCQKSTIAVHKAETSSRKGLAGEKAPWQGMMYKNNRVEVLVSSDRASHSNKTGLQDAEQGDIADVQQVGGNQLAIQLG